MGIPVKPAGVAGVSGTVPAPDMPFASPDSDMSGDIVMTPILAVKGVRVERSDRFREWPCPLPPPTLLLMLVAGECNDEPLECPMEVVAVICENPNTEAPSDPGRFRRIDPLLDPAIELARVKAVGRRGDGLVP